MTGRGWPVHVLFNPSSAQGAARSALADIQQLLPPTARIRPVHDPASFPSAVREAMASGEQLIVACGGDGTVNAVAGALVGQRTCLGIIPNGTHNHFARDLGIPLDPRGAVQVLRSGRTIRVDVGEVNGQVFLNNSSIGLYPSMVQFREAQERSGRGRWAAMTYALLRVLRFHRLLQLRIEIDGRKHRYRTSFLFVGNNRYVQRGAWSRQRLDEGVLWVLTAQEPSRSRLLGLTLRTPLGLLGHAPDTVVHTPTQMTIRSRKPRLDVSYDGEVQAMTTPLRYRIVPRALAVRAPEPDTPREAESV
jgi:diacylglycerol kinase family enzyme